MRPGAVPRCGSQPLARGPGPARPCSCRLQVGPVRRSGRPPLSGSTRWGLGDGNAPPAQPGGVGFATGCGRTRRFSPTVDHQYAGNIGSNRLDDPAVQVLVDGTWRDGSLNPDDWRKTATDGSPPSATSREPHSSAMDSPRTDARRSQAGTLHLRWARHSTAQQMTGEASTGQWPFDAMHVWCACSPPFEPLNHSIVPRESRVR